ncbi:MAG: ECF transporter S component [Ruminococcus sp.]|nr:ECF transporter S component [Ruminococcus sp.]
MKTKAFFNTRQLVILGLMTALVLIFSMTPIGSIPIGPLVITLNVIPIAIAAVSCGPTGGAIIGGVFGIFSFLQCIGIGVPSGMGAALFNISPVLAFIQRFIPRLLDGFLTGWIFKVLRSKVNKPVACGITGFSAAFLNTLFFMSALILLFGSTDYVKELRGGKNVIWFIITFVGINAVFEMLVCTIVTTAVGTALFKARLIPETNT